MQTTKVYVANEDTMELQLMVQPLIDVATGDLYLKLDDVETLLTDIKANQTNGSQFVKVKNVAGTTINPSTEETLSTISSDISTMLGNQTDGDQVVKGNKTPSDNLANPTDAVNAASLLSAWNPAAGGTGQWFRVGGRLLSTVAGGAFTGDNALQTRANLFFYNGSTIDFATGTTANGLDVDVTRSALPTGAATEATLTNGNQIAQAYFKTGTATYQVPRLDTITHSVRTVDYPHSEMHNGDHFYYTDVITLASAATQDYMITTPNTTRWGHFEFELKSQYKVTVNLYESGDRTGTTSQTIFNNNRNSATASTLTIHKGTSGGTTDGTQIWWCTDGSASAAGNPGDLRSGEGELILKQNAKYILRLTSVAANNDMCVKIWWYEHTSLTA